MTLGGPTGPGGAPPPLPPAGAAAIRSLTQAGWIDGRVSALLPEGGARIATVLGLLVAPEAGAGLMPGDRVRLRMNPQTGQIEAQALRSGGTLSTPAAPPQPVGAPAASPAAAPISVAAMLLGAGDESQGAHLTSAALASLSPVPGGAAGVLGTALPPPGSALYGLIAALFPPDVRDRRAAGATRRRGDPSRAGAFDDPEAGETDTGDTPLAAPDPPEAVRRDPLDVIEWGAAETPGDGAEEQGEEAHAPASAPPEDTAFPALPGSDGADDATDGSANDGGTAQIARLNGKLPGGGNVRLDARSTGDVITMLVTSDTPLAPEFARLIRAQAEALARAWGARLTCTFRTLGPDGSARA